MSYGLTEYGHEGYEDEQPGHEGDQAVYECLDCHQFFWKRLRKRDGMRIDPVTDEQVKTNLKNMIVNCGATPNDLDVDLAFTAVENIMTKKIAGRCVVIATQMVPIPGGERNRTWEEITHAIMRELLGWKGM